METKQIVSSILRTIEKELTEFIEGQSENDCPVAYEQQVVELARSYGQKILRQSLGELPKSRNGKKKSLPH